MKCPNTENLSENWWSIRTISSLPVVGDLLPPMNCVPLVGSGNIPAPSSALAFGVIMQFGIVLFGNGCPCTIPAGGVPPGQLAKRIDGLTEAALGTVMAEGNTAPVPAPPASGYSLARGTVWLYRPP